MRTVWLKVGVQVLALMVSTPRALADGKVFAEPVVLATVEVADQQAMVHFANGVERLVIETSFLGEGTNFAWVVPLPAAPEIKPAGEGCFDGLRQMFQPRLIHRVTRYYLGVAFVCALGFLAWRSYKDETHWVADLPLCLVLAAGVGLLGRSFITAAVVLAFLLYARLFTRSTTSVTLVVLVGMTFTAGVAFFNPLDLGLVKTMEGVKGGPEHAEVTILSVQRAGVFDATTIRSENPQALIRWLEQHGYRAPRTIEPVVRDYVERGWVFVASKARRAGNAPALTALHPLVFTFPTPAPVYPMRLTGVENGDCSVDLYVFGEQRAAARHFSAARCDRVNPYGIRRKATGLHLAAPAIADWIGDSAIGTKLTARLSPRQMESDVEIHWRKFSTQGANVFSYSGASTVALNVGVTLGVLGWLFVGGMSGGWGVDAAFVNRWRWRLVIAAIAAGALVFVRLPKVEVIFSPS